MSTARVPTRSSLEAAAVQLSLSVNGMAPAPGFFGRLKRAFSGGAPHAREPLHEHGGESVAETEHERALLENVLELRDKTVLDAMIPRADIIAVDLVAPQSDGIEVMLQAPHSRFPVYRGNLDDTIGMVHVKDVLKGLAAGLDVDLNDLIREVLIVAPSMRVLDLLPEMRAKRVHMAMVVDEFGGIDGLVTIEDLVEMIVGEIQDEHDVDDVSVNYILRDDGTVIVDARLPIETFEERSGIADLVDAEEREEIDTMGGLVFSLAGEVPSRGALIPHPLGIEFEVLDADPRRIKRLRVRGLGRSTDPAAAVAPKRLAASTAPNAAS